MGNYSIVFTELRKIISHPDEQTRHCLIDGWISKYFKHLSVFHHVVNAKNLKTTETQFVFDTLERELIGKASEENYVKHSNDGKECGAEIMIIVPDQPYQSLKPKRMEKPRLIQKPSLKVVDGGKK